MLEIGRKQSGARDLAALAGVIEANQVAQLSILSRTDAGRLEFSDKVMWFMSGISSGGLNGVGWAHFSDQERVETSVLETLDLFRRHNLPMTWWVGPSTTPSDIEKYLLMNALVFTGELKGMAVDLQRPPDQGLGRQDLMIKPAVNRSALEKFMEVFSAGFGLKQKSVGKSLLDLWCSIASSRCEDIRHYLATLNSEPVGIFSLLCAGGVVGVYHVTTVPHVREQGVGTAMMAGALQEAQLLGSEVAVLVSTKRAVDLYQRVGFRECCEFKLYGWSPPSHAGFLTRMTRAKSFLKRLATA